MTKVNPTSWLLVVTLLLTLGIGSAIHADEAATKGDPAPADEDAAAQETAEVYLPPASEVITPFEVDRVVGQALGVKACIGRAESGGQQLPDKFWVEFVIQPDGSIRDAGLVDPSLRNSTLETCLADVLRTRSFPAFAGDANKTVKYPLFPTR